ncbi:MAG: hypothetical protein J0M07_20240 [Anaerolineae bacterium]|nr:hypothetical protein [Anaerolineae bacterium]
MNISPDSSLVSDLSLEQTIGYLETSGWKTVANKGKWRVFEGGQDAEHKPIEIVLPNNASAPDRSLYLSTAVNLLSALNDETPEQTVRNIRLYDRDILMIRNIETDDRDSIPLSLAPKQVAELKKLVAFSASSENSAKPHFVSQAKIAVWATKHYRFGHTFAGSFGYTVEAPLMGMPTKYVQKSLLADEIPDGVILPMERRILERIVRGLIYTQEAVQSQNAGTLVRNYPKGFNSNMCVAIAKISEDAKSPIEYGVQWSAKLSPSQDIAGFRRARVSPFAADLLRSAARELSALNPEYTEVIGPVTALASGDNPMSTRAIDRTVVVRYLRPTGRPLTVRVSLDRDAYVLAHQAHLNWSTISVKGILQNLGYAWVLADPTEFHILR